MKAKLKIFPAINYIEITTITVSRQCRFHQHRDVKARLLSYNTF